MKGFLKKATVALAAGAVLATGFAGTASATTTPADSGFDGINDVTLGGGSDTTYYMMQQLSNLYNQTPGCKTDNASGSATLGQCLTGTAQDATEQRGNWDHDILTQVYPTGSSAGIKALQLGQYSFARSSRAPKSSGETGLNFWAYAKDGLAIVNFPARGNLALTKAQIQGIWNCSITTWGQLLGTSDSSVIEPYGMNTSSGTYATFSSYLGFDPNTGVTSPPAGTPPSSCVKTLPDGTFAFENDMKQIPAADQANAIWWASAGEMKTFAYKRQGVSFATVDGVSPDPAPIANNTYPIVRFLYHVTTAASASTGAGNASGNLVTTGSNSGPLGAARAFTNFICKSKTQLGGAVQGTALTNVYTGAITYDDISNIINGNGFQRTPSAERDSGACKYVPAP